MVLNGHEPGKLFLWRTATPHFGKLAVSMTTEHELRQKLRKISALFEGATTSGERDAAAAAIDRVRSGRIARHL